MNEQEKHREKMQKYKRRVDEGMAKATIERGVIILLTGNGKGKSSSAFGMVMRSLGYGHKVAIIQFIKGAQKTGEELYIAQNHPEVALHQMGTGFTWDSQDREGDIAAAKLSWDKARAALSDPSVQLVVLDELTYMLTYNYLDRDEIIAAITDRPCEQSVVITGRAASSALIELADTVSVIDDQKHAYKAGIKAREGIDF